MLMLPLELPNGVTKKLRSQMLHEHTTRGGKKIMLPHGGGALWGRDIHLYMYAYIHTYIHAHGMVWQAAKRA